MCYKKSYYAGQEAVFQQLQDILQVLSDPDSRRVYDGVLEARRRKESICRGMEVRRKEFRKVLENNEKLYEERKLRKVDEENAKIQRLRTEGNLLIEKEQDDLLKQFDSLVISTKPKEEPILKVKWSKHQIEYSKDDILQVFYKYGNILNVVINQKRHSALVEFENIQAARMAVNIERGFEDRPLVLGALFKDTCCKDIFPKYDFNGSNCSFTDYIKKLENIVFEKVQHLSTIKRKSVKETDEQKTPSTSIKVVLRGPRIVPHWRRKNNMWTRRDHLLLGWKEQKERSGCHRRMEEILHYCYLE